MREDLFAPKFATQLRNLGCDVTRIETNMERGVPDMNVCYAGVEAWIELKVPSAKKILLRPPQLAWGIRRLQHGGRVRLVVYRENQSLIIYRFPLQVVPYNQYVEIVGGECSRFDRYDATLLTFLFT